MDCCRFVAGRFGGNDVAEKSGTTSELNEVLDNESRFEVVRCNGRGGNECRLVGVVMFKTSVEEISAMMDVEWRKEAREPGSRQLDMDTGDHGVQWVTNRGLWATRDQDVPRFSE